jgi:hypothetical protein
MGITALLVLRTVSALGGEQPDSPAEPAKAAEVAPTAQPGPAQVAVAPPPPYVIPWLLRAILAVDVVRWDSSLAIYENPPGQLGATFVSVISGGYKIPRTGGPTEGAQVVARLTVAYDNPPNQPSATIFANPAVGATYARRLPKGWRFHCSLLLTLPVGMGGGDTPNPAESAVRNKAALARAAMENAIYSVNDMTPIPGVAVAYVDHGWTVQGEATLFLLGRVRGEQAQPEAFKVNFTAGLFAGYYVVRKVLSLGLELRYQRWFKGPNSVAAMPSTVQNLSLAGGVRFHVPIGKGWLRCGLAYGGGLNGPLADQHYNLVQFDCPYLF